MSLSLPTFNAWREAEHAALAAERKLYDLMVQSGMCGNSQELQQQAASAKLLRSQAHELFDAAMSEMKDMAAALHHRRVLSDGAVVHQVPGAFAINGSVGATALSGDQRCASNSSMRVAGSEGSLDKASFK